MSTRALAQSAAVTWENVSPGAEPAKSSWVAGIGVPMKGWPRYLLSGALLVYALYVAKAVYDYSSGAKAVAGYAILAVFAVCYLLYPPHGRAGQQGEVLGAVRRPGRCFLSRSCRSRRPRRSNWASTSPLSPWPGSVPDHGRSSSS